MSGAVAAHASYNGSGTQGLAVTNKIHDDDGDVMSVFWNKNDTTRQLLYGSSIIEIPSSGASNLSYGSSRLFTVNNDIDCLGDMYLQIDCSVPQYTSATWSMPAIIEVSKPVAAAEANVLDPGAGYTANSTIKFTILDGSGGKAELTLTVGASGTITGATIGPILGATAYDPGQGVFHQFTIGAPFVTQQPFILQSLIERVEVQVGTQIWQTIENQDLRVVNSTELSPDAFYESSNLTSSGSAAWLVIPSLTKTLGPALGKFTNQTEDGYPMAAAPHQSVKIKVTLVEKFPSSLTWDPATNPRGTVLENIPYSKYNAGIFVYIPTGATYRADNYTFTPPSSVIFTTSIAQPTALNLFAKQQIMCNEEREQMKAMPMGLPKRLKMTQNSYTTDIGSSTIKTIELDHFSLYASHLIISGNAGFDTSGNAIRIKTAELKLNSSSFSGQLPGVLLDSCTSDSLGIFANKYLTPSSGEITVNDFGIGTYVFPLSATAYSGACVPLNRFDSIRLTLTFTDTPVTASSTFVNVTCVGETTALFKGGAASLAMY